MRPIDAVKARDRFQHNLAYMGSEVTDILNTQPTLTLDDIVPHGRWGQVICHDEYEDGFVDRVKECCSVCHAQNWRRTTNYCPNCGAKMDLEE